MGGVSQETATDEVREYFRQFGVCHDNFVSHSDHRHLINIIGKEFEGLLKLR